MEKPTLGCTVYMDILKDWFLESKVFLLVYNMQKYNKNLCLKFGMKIQIIYLL